MKRIVLSLLVLTLSMVMVLTPIMAQDDTQSFTSADGSLSFEYPSDWVVSPVDGVYVVASDEALNIDDLPIPAGEMFMGILSPDFLPNLGLETTTEPATVATTALGAFAPFVEEEGEPVETEFNGNPVVYIHVSSASDDSVDYLVVAIGFEDGTLTLVGVTALHEMETALPIFLSIAESATYGASEPVDADNLAVITTENVGSLREVLDLSNENYDIRQVAVSPDGTLVALNYYSYSEDAESDHGLTVVDVASGEIIWQMNSPQYDNLVFSADSSQLLYNRTEYADDDDFAGTTYEGTIDIATGDSAEAESEALVTLYLDVNGETVQLLVSIAEDETSAHIVLADLETADVITELEIGLDDIYQLYDLNPDNSAFLVSTETSIHTLDIASGELSDPLYTSTAEYPEFDTAAFSPDGSLVALSDYETYSVFIVDIATGEILVTVDRSEIGDSLNHLTFSADGSVLFVAERAGILAIDVASGEILVQMPQIVDGNLEDLAISADGRVIVGGGYESVMIWGVAGE